MTSGFDEKVFVLEMDRLREEQFLKQLNAYEEQIAPMMRQQGYKRVFAPFRQRLLEKVMSPKVKMTLRST